MISAGFYASSQILKIVQNVNPSTPHIILDDFEISLVMFKYKYHHNSYYHRTNKDDYNKVYMLWFNVILGSIFYFPMFYTHTLPYTETKENKN